jgi:hypothetical protein
MALEPVASALATDAAFFAIFGIFVAAMVVLVVVVVVWAVRHDMAGRKAWRQRQEAAGQGPPAPPSPPRATSR